MGISLVSALFDMGTLLESNVKGGKSKTNKNAKVHSTLDEKKILAVRCKYYHRLLSHKNARF